MTFDADLIDQQKEIEEAEAEVRRVRDEAENIAAQIAELKRQQEILENKRWSSGQIIQKAQNRKRQATVRIEEINAQIRVEQANAKKLAELEAIAETLEERTAQAKWRLGILTESGEAMAALPHQIQGAHFLATAKRAILADSMGVGKTLTSIATLDMLGAKRVLIVCPGEVMTGFVKEITRWSDRPPMVIGKKPKKDVRNILNMTKMANLEKIVFIINYESWAKDKALLTELESIQFDTVILDEAHTVKETDTSAFLGVQKIVMSQNKCDTCGQFGSGGFCFRASCSGQLVRSVENVFCMTGTPILNRPEELYALLHLIAPQEFYSRASFRRSYLKWDYELNAYVFRSGGEASLAERLSGVYLRRTHKSAGIVLPKQDVIIHEIELDPELYPLQAEILRTLGEDAAILVENGKAEQMDLLSLITRQRQASVWPGGIVLHEKQWDEFGLPIVDWETGKQVVIDNPVGLNYQESVKIDRAVELTKEFIEDEQRTVVFSQFRSVLEELQQRYEKAGIRAVSFHGGTTPAVREAIKNNFDRSRGEQPKWEVVLCHYKTGGVGLNLTAATATIIMDEEWNPGKNTQAYDRTHRIGQTDETSIHILRLVGSNSIDPWVEELNVNKGVIIGKFEKANDDAKRELVNMFRGKK